MDSWPAWVRWLLVLPASFLVLALCMLVQGFAVLALGAGRLDLIVPVRVGISFIVAVLFILSGSATAPRAKSVVALLLAALPLWLAYQDYSARAMGLRTIGPYEQTANEVFSFLLDSAIALVVGVVVAWGLVLRGYFRRRQAGLPSR